MKQFLIKVSKLVYDPKDVPYQHASVVMADLEKYNDEFSREDDFHICGEAFVAEAYLSDTLRNYLERFNAQLDARLAVKNDPVRKDMAAYTKTQKFTLCVQIDTFREGCLAPALKYFTGKEYMFPFPKDEFGTCEKPEGWTE